MVQIYNVHRNADNKVLTQDVSTGSKLYIDNWTQYVLHAGRKIILILPVSQDFVGTEIKDSRLILWRIL